MAEHDSVDLDPRLLLGLEVLAVLSAAAFLAYYVYPLLGIVVVGGYAIIQRQIVLSRRARLLVERARQQQGQSRFADPAVAPDAPAGEPTPHVFRASDQRRE